MVSQSKEILQYAFGKTWLGPFILAVHGTQLRALFLGDDHDQLMNELSARFPISELQDGTTIFQPLVSRIADYAKSLDCDLPCELDVVGTEFQKAVWSELLKIPRGETTTYSELSKRLGKEKSYRAVANACGANPISLLIPCHRVVRSDGSLSGYRWGIEKKAKLLEHEKLPINKEQ